MAQIKIQTIIEKNKVETFLNNVYTICKTDPNLSPRPMNELKNAYRKGLLLIASDELSVVGWLLRIPFNRNCQELAAGYVIKEHRSLGVFNKLLQTALPLTQSSIIVTFNYRFANNLIQKMGFRRSSLIEATKVSKTKFLFNRMNFDRVKAILNHYQTNKPIYTIFTNE